MKSAILAGAVLWGLASAAWAGPVAEFETAFRQTYGAYRVALFRTNAGQQADSVAALGQVQAGLTAMMARYRDAPPPHYADDPQWAETLDKVAALVAAAQGEVDAGQLPQAHETLEGVRDLIGDLHARNSVETFSDRMNAYHAEMEHVLALDLSGLDAAAMGDLRERAGVLGYLAQDVLGAPPPEAAGNAEYDGLAKAFAGSVEALRAAVRGDDAEQIKAAVGGLKVPYSKLFLKFG
ncbi:MAG: hypothetical protein KDK26_01450 [Roseivivax sp.]|nr:hypothetical protein [Roseivivax sp.]